MQDGEREGPERPTSSVPASRVDRLLLQRLRKSQSTTVLYGDQGGELLDSLVLSAGAGVGAGAGLFPQLDGGAARQRLIVVANRLPVSAYKDRAGKWQLQARGGAQRACVAGGGKGGWGLGVSAGGLVSALMGVGNFQTKWIGWPGVYIEAGPERDELTAALHREGYVPVYLDQKTCDLHYNGFCNSVLWQLFHYVPLNIGAGGPAARRPPPRPAPGARHRAEPKLARPCPASCAHS
eukprot:scaffold2.g6844.t1